MMKRKFFYLSCLIIATAVLTLFAGYLTFPTQAQTYNGEQLLRLHVVANSDSEEDQALKRQVRDKVVAKTYLLFRHAKNAQEAKVIAQQNLSVIRDIAQEEVKRAGKPYAVKAEIGNFAFPAKNYGSLNLAAGNYQALRVVIGSGSGKNWWCVLFPPLCFIDAENGLALDRLADNQDVKSSSIKLRFKLLEVWQKEHHKGDKYLAKASN